MHMHTRFPMKISTARAIHLRAPLEDPYRTTFGTMTHRQAVIIELVNEDGTTGVGESWINFPSWAPFERMAAYRDGFFPILVGKKIESVTDFVRELWNRHYRSALQSATLGPLVQALCAIEAAFWDIQARNTGIPLSGLFSETAVNSLDVYGSGINPPFSEKAIRTAQSHGIRTFKLKLGYGDAEDRSNIECLKRMLGVGTELAVDVNRSWSYDHTLQWIDYLRDEGVSWLEEPLCIEEQHRYGELFAQTDVPISAGENFLIPPGVDFSCEGVEGFSLNQSGLALHIIQPAVVKNCTFSDAVRLAEIAENSGKRLCPHFLGSAPGLATTAHLASLTRTPFLEWDINPNPLRTHLFRDAFSIKDGKLRISEEPGIGWTFRQDVPPEWVMRVETVSG